ncbi:MAG: heparan-alpha-glucosaminide N-acetyltransferase domain-containing protein [Puia sp.]
MHYNVSIDQDPLDFSNTTVFLFLTRWITNFCAPVFVFLSGTGIFLYSSKVKSKKQTGFFLLTRGVWLMLVELLIIQPLWDFNLIVIFLQVIWAIGLSMVVLSVLQFLPFRVLLAIGLILIFGHNLLDKILIESPFWESVSWSIIHQRHSYLLNEHLMFTVQYPFLPWLGLMIMGYSAGRLYLPGFSPASRKKILRITGLVAILFFVFIRLINQYGDMHSWAIQKTHVFTLLDFVKTTKYPPSLLYILMTIGPA